MLAIASQTNIADTDMLSKIIDWSARNVFLVLLTTAIIVGICGYAVKQTPLDAIPDLSDVQIIIYTEYPGQAPQVVEDQITYPLSTAMLAVPKSKVVRGLSVFGASFIYVIFEDDTDIYWGSGSVVTPLLYIADKQVQPLQLNGIYPKREGGDRDELEKNGYYNAESVRDWRENADYILVQHVNMGEFWGNYLDPELFDELTPTAPIDPCEPLSVIKIFRRK